MVSVLNFRQNLAWQNVGRKHCTPSCNPPFRFTLPFNLFSLKSYVNVRHERKLYFRCGRADILFSSGNNKSLCSEDCKLIRHWYVFFFLCLCSMNIWHGIIVSPTPALKDVKVLIMIFLTVITWLLHAKVRKNNLRPHRINSIFSGLSYIL